MKRKSRAATPSTPFEQGLWMRAEWEHHEARWLAWPHQLSDWPGKFGPIPWAFAEIVRHLANAERVYLLVQNRQAESRVRVILKESGANLANVDFFRVPTHRGWMRDSGPIVVKRSSGEVAFTHRLFTALSEHTQLSKDPV